MILGRKSGGISFGRDILTGYYSMKASDGLKMDAASAFRIIKRSSTTIITTIMI